MSRVKAKIRVWITARNVVNTDEIRNQLKVASDRAMYQRGKTWVLKNVYNYLINDFDSRNEVYLVQNESDLTDVFKSTPKIPKWALSALEKSEELYIIEPDHQFWSNLSHIVDYLNTQDRDWSRVSFPQMEKLVSDWDEELKKQVKKETNKDNFKHLFNSGQYQWVEILTPEGLKDEGAKMGHCVGGESYCLRLGKGTRIFSLRDKDFDKPHVTVEVEEKSIIQIQGRGNTPQPKYASNVIDFLNKTKYKIDIGLLSAWGLIQHADGISTLTDLPGDITFEASSVKFAVMDARRSVKSKIYLHPIILKGRIVRLPKAVSVYANCTDLGDSAALIAPKALVQLNVSKTCDLQKILTHIKADALSLKSGSPGKIRIPSDLTKFSVVQISAGDWYIPNDLKVNKISTTSIVVKRRLEEIGILKPSVQDKSSYDISKITSPLIRTLIDISNAKGGSAVRKEISRITGESPLSGDYLYGNFSWYFSLIKQAFPSKVIKLNTPLPPGIVAEVKNILRFIQTLFPPASKTVKSIDYILNGKIEGMVNPKMICDYDRTWFLWSSQLSR